MSDLHCPATILLISAGSFLRHGLRAASGSQRLTEVFFAMPVAAEPEVLALARALAADVECVPVSREDIVDGPSLASAMESLADLHRGETIAVLAPAGVIEAALGVTEVGDDAFAVTIDFDGWSVKRVPNTRGGTGTPS